MTIYYATSAGAGSKSGADWANAWSKTEWKTWVQSTCVADDHCYIMQGTYAITGLSTTRSGSASTGPIKLIGVKTGTTAEPPTVSDYAYSTDRPVIEASSFYGISFITSHWWFLNLSFQLDTGNIRLGGLINNCYINAFTTSDTVFLAGYITMNTYVLAPYLNSTKIAFSGGTTIYRCMAEAGDGIAFNVNSSGTKFISQCIAKDSDTGIYNSGTNTFPAALVDNTIYNCTKGISNSSNDFSPTICLNNSISDCTDGFYADQSGDVDYGRLWDYNNWYNNTHDLSFDAGSSEDNSFKGPHDIDSNPDFTDADNDDFTISNDSGNLGTGIGVRD